jgi:hypothetical protein
MNDNNNATTLIIGVQAIGYIIFSHSWKNKKSPTKSYKHHR